MVFGISSRRSNSSFLRRLSRKLVVTDRQLLDAKDLQADPYGLSRYAAYELLHQIGVRVTPRRLVVLRERLLAFLGGEGTADP